MIAPTMNTCSQENRVVSLRPIKGRIISATATALHMGLSTPRPAARLLALPMC